MPLQEAADIRRKKPKDIDDELRTPGKDEVAEYIEQEIAGTGRWPMTMPEIAEQVDYSRQHVANVVRDYFEPVDDNEDEKTVYLDRDGHVEPITVAVPSDVDPESFVRGFVQAAK